MQYSSTVIYGVENSLPFPCIGVNVERFNNDCLEIVIYSIFLPSRAESLSGVATRATLTSNGLARLHLALMACLDNDPRQRLELWYHLCHTHSGCSLHLLYMAASARIKPELHSWRMSTIVGDISSPRAPLVQQIWKQPVLFHGPDNHEQLARKASTIQKRHCDARHTSGCAGHKQDRGTITQGASLESPLTTVAGIWTLCQSINPATRRISSRKEPSTTSPEISITRPLFKTQILDVRNVHISTSCVTNVSTTTQRPRVCYDG